MNEKIKQLAEQAGAIEAKDITNIPRALSLNGEEIEKFAELIVQECAKIADVERPSSLGCGYITKTKGMLIRERFGVKEKTKNE